MNARQALKSVLKKNKELAYHVARSAADITLYNECILGMIKGESPCEWCNDREECQLEAKELGNGCEDWLLTFDVVVRMEESNGHQDGDGDHRGEGRTLPCGEKPCDGGTDLAGESIRRMEDSET